MTVDIHMLIEWLGVEGAQAGMLASDLTIADLHEIATQLGIDVPARAKRADIVASIFSKYRHRIDKPIDDLMRMSYEEIVEYFVRVKPDRSDILDVLRQIAGRQCNNDNVNNEEIARREIHEK